MTLETATLASGTRSASRLLRPLAAAATAIPSLYLLVVRPWHLRWGATDAEVRQPLPGDDLVSQPKLVATRAISIRAPASQVWPWLVQLGQGRGGLYSYEWLENLAGCDIHNADRIIPELQHLAVGDSVRLGPEGYSCFTVMVVDPERALVLYGGPRDGGPADGPAWSWAFTLAERGDGTTRLVVRSRLDYRQNLANILLWRVCTEPAHFVMEQKMLRGIRKRADRRRVRKRGSSPIAEPAIVAGE
jgi:hypothetical protein